MSKKLKNEFNDDFDDFVPLNKNKKSKSFQSTENEFRGKKPAKPVRRQDKRAYEY